MASAINIESQIAETSVLLFNWSRFRFYDLVLARARLQIDISSAMILGMLARVGPARTSDLAEHMRLDSSTVSRHVAKVVDRGWATRVADATDGRAAMVSLTPSGKRAREKLWGQWEQVVRDVTSTWTPEERELWLELLSRFYDGVTAEPV